MTNVHELGSTGVAAPVDPNLEIVMKNRMRREAANLRRLAELSRKMSNLLGHLSTVQLEAAAILGALAAE